MGLLDEAIREHLELKRLHGASEDELRDKESEALGPARREPPAAVYDEEGPETDLAAQAPPPSPDEAVPLEPPLEQAETQLLDAEETLPADTAIHADGPPPAEEPSLDESVEPEPHEAEPAADVIREPPPVDLPEEPSPLDDDLVPREEEPPEPVDRRPLPPEVEDEEPARPGEDEEPPEPGEDEPHQESPPLPELEEEPTGEQEGEALLEETPDFLQETPEHDRLWFEQKPPRKFDFDE
jgi:hypothetical protein